MTSDDEIRAALIGTWQGTGQGHYTTIEDFGYRESVTFTDSGRGFLLYSQRTMRLDSDQGMHLEEGFVRVTPDGTVELVTPVEDPMAVRAGLVAFVDALGCAPEDVTLVSATQAHRPGR